MKTKQALVPKLRFGEFESEWARLPISELIENGSIESHLDGNHGELYPRSEEFSDVGTPYISANDFVVGEIDFNTCKKLPPKRAEKFKKGISKNGDVLFAHNATVGPVTLLKTKLPYVILSTTATYFRCNTEKLHNSFLMFSLTANYFVRQYVRVMSQSTRNQVPITMQRKFVLQLPALPEQEKIAGFLTSVDDRIDQLKRKKSLLQDYKKGVMQKLFSQELRFKDDNGDDYPDWEEKKLGEVIHTLRSGLSADQNQQRKGYKVSRIETISNGTINLNKVGFVETDKDISNYRIEEGDMLFSNINSVKHIGKIAYAKNTPDLYHGMNLLLIRFGKNHNSLFFYHLLTSIPLKHYFERICNQAVSQASINQSDLKKTPLTFPSHPEQTKIANFLSTLDKKIEQIDTQITQTQTFKKALLQQMFV